MKLNLLTNRIKKSYILNFYALLGILTFAFSAITFIYVFNPVSAVIGSGLAWVILVGFVANINVFLQIICLILLIPETIANHFGYLKIESESYLNNKIVAALFYLGIFFNLVVIRFNFS